MRKIKCKYCGKSYDSPSEMHKRQCHSHPKGAWKGNCTSDAATEFFWSQEKQWEDDRKRHAEAAIRRKKDEAEVTAARREYKSHTPFLDCVLERHYFQKRDEWNQPIKYLELNQFAVELANGINSKTNDAINTIYALRDGCDYVLNNADAQQEGHLHDWLNEIKQLKDKVVGWDFWVAVYWLSSGIRKDRNTVFDSTAKLFQTRYVIPMLHVTKNKGDANEIKVKDAIVAHLRGLQSTEKGFLKVFEMLNKRINDYDFWGVLYCLYWMQLRPTPWSDKKVWPIPVAQKPSAPDARQVTKSDSKDSTTNTPSVQQSSKADSKSVIAKVSNVDFARKLLERYQKNFTPFKKIWIYKANTLVFDEYSVDRKIVAIDIAVLPDNVANVTLFMRNGNLNDVQALVNKNTQLKGLLPEIVAQRLRHSKISYADMPAFVDKVLAALRSPVPQTVTNVDASSKVSSRDFAKKLRDAYLNNYAPFKKLWIYGGNTLVFDEYTVEGHVVAIDVAVLQDSVNVTIFMRNGNLADVQAFVNKSEPLRNLLTEVVAQRLRHSQIAYADVPSFIDRVLAALRL